MWNGSFSKEAYQRPTSTRRATQVHYHLRSLTPAAAQIYPRVALVPAGFWGSCAFCEVAVLTCISSAVYKGPSAQPPHQHWLSVVFVVRPQMAMMVMAVGHECIWGTWVSGGSRGERKGCRGVSGVEARSEHTQKGSAMKPTRHCGRSGNIRQGWTCLRYTPPMCGSVTNKSPSINNVR
jgi:hypothetical protein